MSAHGLRQRVLFPGRAVARAVAWAAVGAVLGGAALGLYGILCGLLSAALRGDLDVVLPIAGSVAMAGAAAGALTGAVALWLDGYNPLSRDSARKVLAPRPRGQRLCDPRVVLPDAILDRLRAGPPPRD